MAKHNRVSLLGIIQKKPVIRIDDDGNFVMCLAFIRVTRGPRDVGDNRFAIKYDSPVIVSRDPEIVKKMNGWEVGDAIDIKGVIVTQATRKKSMCKNEECRAVNEVLGVLVYINPLHALKVAHFDSDEASMAFLQDNAEISNEVQLMGTLVRDPKKITPKTGLTVTQYQIAMNRKYKIPTDPPEIKTDYPWVKAYGANAIADRQHLHVGSEIYIDGCIQARNVLRHNKCSACGQEYEWKDSAMEIVPFATEYLTNFYSEEEIEKREQERLEQIKNDLFKRNRTVEDERGNVPDDELTDNEIEEGVGSA